MVERPDHATGTWRRQCGNREQPGPGQIGPPKVQTVPPMRGRDTMDPREIRLIIQWISEHLLARAKRPGHNGPRAKCGRTDCNKLFLRNFCHSITRMAPCASCVTEKTLMRQTPRSNTCEPEGSVEQHLRISRRRSTHAPAAGNMAHSRSGRCKARSGGGPVPSRSGRATRNRSCPKRKPPAQRQAQTEVIKSAPRAMSAAKHDGRDSSR